ncbi:hypothetical protein TNCV_1711231 [Trichonephila clavipes]|nr:hypothetical protein TNCV_1711231 [Trichonephila clavipes]
MLPEISLRSLLACRTIHRPSLAVVFLGRPPPTFLTAIRHMEGFPSSCPIPKSCAKLLKLRSFSSEPIILPHLKET